MMHESEIDIGRAVLTVAWDTYGEDYEGSLFEPPSHACVDEWKVIAPEITLTSDEKQMVNKALVWEFEQLRQHAKRRRYEY